MIFTLALVIGLLCLSGTASASTTSYQLVTPNENLSLGYDGGYYRIGDLKVTAADSFDTNYKVVVTINRASAFTNQSVDTRPTMSYDLVISPDNRTIASGDSFDFTAASIDAQEGLEIGTVVKADFLTAADGFYMDSLTFRASLAPADSTSEQLTVGGTYTFGTYNSAAITWRVLSVDVANNRALLITEQALETRAYHSSYASITWENCSLRSWLNGDFLNNFTTAEQSKIVEVTNTNPNNSSYGTSGGNATSDKMFLLSIDEAYSYFSNDDARKCTLLSDNSDSGWWLRSPVDTDIYAAYVNSDGSVADSGNLVGNSLGVRPAFWLNLE